jgi:hypothetical protein
VIATYVIGLREGLEAALIGELAALLVVYGSYALARGLQSRRRRRAVTRTAGQAAARP